MSTIFMNASSRPVYFPPITSADRYGLVRLGGSLSVPWLLEAYRRGIFPWPLVDGNLEVLAWWSPDPRAIIELDQLHVSRRLRRRIRSEQFRVTCDTRFTEVVAGCAAPRKEDAGTWITPALADAYQRIHELGYAHSVEVWQAQRLVGGVYGVALGGFFAGESMFHRLRDASKVALVYLVEHLRARGYQLFDIQQWTPHTGSLGAIEIPRREYIRRLEHALALPVSFGQRS
jgi:leucyl/phenylalanyl-tRNA--protein transferase